VWRVRTANRSEDDKKEWQVGSDFDICDPALLNGAYIVTQQTSDGIITPYLKVNIPHNHACAPTPLATPLLHSKKSGATIKNTSHISLLQSKSNM
jgi:hypothetical protein